MGIQGSGSLENFETVRAWRHHEVGKDNVELFSGVQKAQSFRSTLRGSETESARLHVFTECQPEVTVVFDNQQSSFAWKEIRNLDHEVLIGKFVENFNVQSIMNNFLKAGGCIGFESGTDSGC